MKLIRHGELNKEKPGVILDDKFYDVSAFGEDYNEQFFESGGLDRLRAFVAANKGTLKAFAGRVSGWALRSRGLPRSCVSDLITWIMRGRRVQHRHRSR